MEDAKISTWETLHHSCPGGHSRPVHSDIISLLLLRNSKGKGEVEVYTH